VLLTRSFFKLTDLSSYRKQSAIEFSVACAAQIDLFSLAHLRKNVNDSIFYLIRATSSANAISAVDKSYCEIVVRTLGTRRKDSFHQNTNGVEGN
jgi:hypothetical protein